MSSGVNGCAVGVGASWVEGAHVSRYRAPLRGALDLGTGSHPLERPDTESIKSDPVLEK